MAMTKAERRAAAKKAAKTRLRNELKAEIQAENIHDVERPDEQRTAQQTTAEMGTVDLPAPTQDWVRPAELDAPEPRAGYTQRWIRIKLGNEDDSRNSMRKFREGWLPRKAETVPEGYAPPTFLHSRLGSVIGVEDLILCEMPISKAEQRNAYYMQRRDKMIEGIENDLRNVSRGGPRIAKDHKTQVTKRRLRVPADPAGE
jgi:hypothetical protein